MSSINRKNLVRRHNPVIKEWDSWSPLSVGNGDFVFTADFTGLQSCSDSREGSMPRCTMSQWGFHSYPDAPKDDGDLILKQYRCGDRFVGYMSDQNGQEDLFNRLRINPHRFDLARIGLYMKSAASGSGLAGIPEDVNLLKNHISETLQTLDLWTGTLKSSFLYDGHSVNIQTVCHPELDMISVRIESILLKEGELGLDIGFPYGSHEIDGADWSGKDRHFSSFQAVSSREFLIKREMDSTLYSTEIHFSGEGLIRYHQNDEHRWIFTSDAGIMEFSISFSRDKREQTLPSFSDTLTASAGAWEKYWCGGAAVSFEGSTDERAGELERRIILSQYLLGLQSLGSLPPAETGLTCNSWYGKFHLEMHVWHTLHGTLWNRSGLVEKSLPWYEKIMPGARTRAEEQGYKGIRWPKMTDPSGRDSPSPIGTLLCWQQPHIILFAELLYREKQDESILRTYSRQVFETAEFMADYVLFDEKNERYILGPPLIPAQENHAPEDTLNPCFELEYWRWALKTAIQWKTRINEKAPEQWMKVLSGLSLCPVDKKKNSYAAHENCTDSYGEFATDHPSMLLAYGFLPQQTIDPDIMSHSYDTVVDCWQMETMWGWDFPSMAMTLARLGRRHEAVDALLMKSPKNTYLVNGHNRQIGHDALPLYLPGNGALLLAAAMMAAGWDGSCGQAPGFPDDGSWKVVAEGFSPYL